MISSAQADARDSAAAEQARLTQEIERKRAEADSEARRVQEEVALTRAEAKGEARRVQEELAAVKQAAADEQAQLAMMASLRAWVRKQPRQRQLMSEVHHFWTAHRASGSRASA